MSEQQTPKNTTNATSDTTQEQPASFNVSWDGKPLDPQQPEAQEHSASEQNTAAQSSAPDAPAASLHQEADTREPVTPLQMGSEERASKAPASGKMQQSPPKKGTGPFDGKSLGPLLTATPVYREMPGGPMVPVPPTILSRLYALLAFFPLLPLLALIAAQVVFTLDTRALWYSDEVRYANALQNMMQSGQWFVLQLNDVSYPDKPPLYFWLLAAISHLLNGEISPRIFFIGSAVSGTLCLLATYALARLVGRVDRRTAFAAGLILLTGFFFSGLLHYLRMDLLFAACITLSHIFLFHAFVRDKAKIFMILAFMLGGAATLIKGPFGLAFPLLTGLVFLMWQGRITRLFRLDFILGLIMGLAIPAAWLFLAWQTAGDGFIDNILGQQIAARALKTWHHAQPWYHYFITFPLIWLPWTLLILFLPWNRLFAKTTFAALRTSRTKETAGIAYLWCAVLSGFALLSAVSIKLPIYCLPLFPPLAILCARAFLQLSPRATKAMQVTLALIFFILAVALAVAPMLPQTSVPLPLIPKGTFILAGISMVTACLLAFGHSKRRPEGMLLTISLFFAVFSYPAWSISAPDLDAFMSPKAQAEEMKRYRDAGYYCASYKVYPGTYSYYAGNIHELKQWEQVQKAIATQPNIVLALRAEFWTEMHNKPEGFTLVHRQTIAERDYVLLAKPALAPVRPVQVETQPASKTQQAPQETPAPVVTPALPATDASPKAASDPAPSADTTPAADVIPAQPRETSPTLTPGNATTPVAAPPAVEKAADPSKQEVPGSATPATPSSNATTPATTLPATGNTPASTPVKPATPQAQ